MIAGGQWNVGVDTNRRSNRLFSSAAHSSSFLSLALRTRHSADFSGSIGLPKFWLQSSAKKNQRQLIRVTIVFIFLIVFLFVFVFPSCSCHRLVSFRTHFTLVNQCMFLMEHVLIRQYGQLLVCKQKDLFPVRLHSVNLNLKIHSPFHKQVFPSLQIFIFANRVVQCNNCFFVTAKK